MDPEAWKEHGRGVVRGVTVLGGGNALAQGVVVLAAPVLSRLYLPTDFGLMAVVASLVGLGTWLSTLSYHEAIVLPRRDEHALDLVMFCILLLLCAAGLTGVLVFILEARIEDVLGTSASVLPWFIPLGILLGGGMEIFDRWAVRTRQYRRIATSRLAQSIAQEGSRIALAWMVGGAVGLVAGYLLGIGAAVSVLLLGATGTGLLNRGWRRLRRVAVRYRRFPKLAAPATLLNNGGFYLPPLLFAFLYGPEVAGWFAVATKVLLLPMNVVGRASSQVFVGELGRLHHRDPAALRPLFLRFAAPLCALGMMAAAVLLVAGPELFDFVFGDEWREAGRYARWLGLMAAAQLVASPLTHPSLLERQELALLWGAGRVLLLSAGILLPFFLGLGASAAVITFSAAMVLFYALGILLMLHAIVRHQER